MGHKWHFKKQNGTEYKLSGYQARISMFHESFMYIFYFKYIYSKYCKVGRKRQRQRLERGGGTGKRKNM